MILITSGYKAVYEVESLARMLFPGTQRVEGEEIPISGDYIFTSMQTKNGECRMSVCIRMGEKALSAEGFSDASLNEKQRVFDLCKLLYNTSCELLGENLRWGMLTGIRPIKLYHNLASKGLSDSEIAAEMQKKYLISDEMNELALGIRRSEAMINAKSIPMGFSLYISIPFCPQRCSYCSFVSASVEHMRPLIPQYVEFLCREIRKTAEIARRLGLSLQTVYFGGGTPTTLDANQLKMLFDTIEEEFDLGGILEYTVEAGRPDTIDRDRLLALKNAGVGRISVNPQTMNDRILSDVGRRHTSKDIVAAYKLAREIGFDSINMDLIAGLSDETPEEFLSSLDQVIALDPENITVHTLTLKRASTLSEEGAQEQYYRRRSEVTRMVDGARRKLASAGYEAYYLYRQKNTIGALDNTGYAKPGKEGCYNVFIMDETHTILACGAGAVTKLKAPYSDEIERIYNYKFPKEYIERFDEMLRRKEGVVKFYEDYNRK
ncbi:MAG: coproporphyrinogen dehydrogenase HemZ [Oscillospiraceae bacterium]|nr:coproporphyrinogen dehydrogenase HemZ [Oscillospiraceae bacterium]